jgi:hypothetical protein
MNESSWLLTTLTVVALGVAVPHAQQSPPIEPEAMAALQKMGGYLRTLKAFQVDAVNSTEDVLQDRQKVKFSGVTNLVARMPDRLRIDVTSDRRSRLFLYDGKQFTLYARRANQYATIPAPATIGELADTLDDKYNLALPLEDLFRWGGPESRDSDIKSAMFIGPSECGGVTCGHYAFRQEGLDWQIWIQYGDFPLPRRIVLTTTTDEARPQYEATYTWNLAPSFNDQSFTFVPPKDAGRVVLEHGTAPVEK